MTTPAPHPRQQPDREQEGAEGDLEPERATLDAGGGHDAAQADAGAMDSAAVDLRQVDALQVDVLRADSAQPDTAAAAADIGACPAALSTCP